MTDTTLRRTPGGVSARTTAATRNDRGAAAHARARREPAPLFGSAEPDTANAFDAVTPAHSGDGFSLDAAVRSRPVRDALARSDDAHGFADTRLGAA
jgi:hypothetical protein